MIRRALLSNDSLPSAGRERETICETRALNLPSPAPPLITASVFFSSSHLSSIHHGKEFWKNDPSHLDFPLPSTPSSCLFFFFSFFTVSPRPYVISSSLPSHICPPCFHITVTFPFSTLSPDPSSPSGIATSSYFSCYCICLPRSSLVAASHFIQLPLFLFVSVEWKIKIF